MATNTRKRPAPNLTKSAASSVDEMAREAWGKFYTPDPNDAEKTAAAFKRASDQVQEMMAALRKLRDENKPVLRERKASEDVIKEAVGKTVTELQAAYIQLPISGEGDDAIVERVSIPKLKTFVEREGHPYHGAAVAFLKAHNLTFVERENPNGRGKKASALEKVQGRQKAA